MKPIDAGRRRLLGLPSTPPADEGSRPTITTPVVDPALCNACDACIRVCAPGALRFEHAPACYLIDAARCTNCGLCVDVCDRAAVRLESGAAAAAASVRVVLYSVRCQVCGTDFRSAQPEPAGNCRFCSRPGAARGALRLQD